MPEVKKRTCHLCEANCGLLVEVEGREVLSIRGNPDHVLSGGYICPKATAIADLESDPDRLRQPVKRVDGEWVEVSWETALSEIAERTGTIRGAGKSAAVYIGNPTAHNYLVSMQFKPFTKALGVRGIYSASTLDQLPHELIHKWLYGHRNLAPIADIDRTQYMVILGGNPAASNGSLWTVPGVKQRIKDLRARGGKLVVVDPRATETAKLADEHHFIRPGGDIAFLIGLLLALDEAGLVRPGRLLEFLDTGWTEAWSLIREFELGDVARFCGVSEAAIRSIAAELGSGRPAILYGRMGTCVQQHGTVNQWLIQLINIATGNLDREGGVLFNEPLVDFTAMTGGGTYGRFRTRVSDRPEVLGELPAGELASEITTPGEGEVGALFTIAGNPVLSSPGGRHLDAALATLDLMVSIDMYINETTRHADYILPPCGPLEKDHYPIFLAGFAVRNFACYSQPVFEKTSFDDGEIISQLTVALMGGVGSGVTPAASSRDALAAMVDASPRGVAFSDLEAAADRP